MKTAKNRKAISKILFILMLLLATIIGSIFSYLILAGYYINLGIEIPKKSTIAITASDLDTQNTLSRQYTSLRFEKTKMV